MRERILVVEDDRELRTLITEVLEAEDYRPLAFSTADDALERLEAGQRADLVITDLILPGKRGHELLEWLRRARPELNVIIITAFGSIDDAIQMIKAGAYDYLPKPFQMDHLLLVVRRALAESELRREVAKLRREASAPPAGFVAASKAMHELFDRLRLASTSPRPVLLSGESGTGKELAARAIHELSGRSAFVPVNCGALPEHLLESELFGHEKGAFTGASRDRTGLFQAADGGTLFLDEVGELPRSLQPKLLRALEQGEVRRVGSTRARTVDVRIVAATNKDLEAEVGAGRFREDLFWRLNVLHLRIPPLRERIADVPVLAEHFLEQAAEGPDSPTRIAPDAMAILTGYSWPGNVRELRNVIERTVTMVAADEIRPEELPSRIRERGAARVLAERAARERLSLRELEHVYILKILDEVDGNKSHAAEVLGIDRKTLYRKLERYDEDSVPLM